MLYFVISLGLNLVGISASNMTKDRLASLKRAQIGNCYVGVRNKKRDDNMEMFFQEVENIKENIEEMRVSVEQMKKIHSQLICPPNTDEMKQKLEDVMEVIKRIANKVRQRLKVMELTQNLKQSDQTSLKSTDFRIRKTQHSMLSQMFIEVMTDNYKSQTDYMESCKNVIKRELEITNTSFSDENIEEMLNTGNHNIFTQEIMTDIEPAEQTLTKVRERHSEIIKLENSIRELHDMFMDMTFIIESQGEMLDSTGIRVEKTEKNIVIALEKTKTAEKLKQKSRRKKILITGKIVAGAILLGVVVVVGGVIGI